MVTENTRRTPFSSAFLSENCLVSAYLVGLLRQEPSFRPVSMGALQRHGMRAEAALTFVIDASHLGLACRTVLAPIASALPSLSIPHSGPGTKMTRKWCDCC